MDTPTPGRDPSHPSGWKWASWLSKRHPYFECPSRERRRLAALTACVVIACGCHSITDPPANAGSGLRILEGGLVGVFEGQEEVDLAVQVVNSADEGIDDVLVSFTLADVGMVRFVNTPEARTVTTRSGVGKLGGLSVGGVATLKLDVTELAPGESVSVVAALAPGTASSEQVGQVTADATGSGAYTAVLTVKAAPATDGDASDDEIDGSDADASSAGPDEGPPAADVEEDPETGAEP